MQNPGAVTSDQNSDPHRREDRPSGLSGSRGGAGGGASGDPSGSRDGAGGGPSGSRGGAGGGPSGSRGGAGGGPSDRDQPPSRAKNVKDKIPPQSKIKNSGTFKKKNLAAEGLINQGANCCINTLVILLHRMNLQHYITDIKNIVDVSTGNIDETMSLLKQILEALPSEKPFGVKAFMDSWNADGRRGNIDRPQMGNFDDITMVDAVLSEAIKFLKPRPSNKPLITRFVVKMKCEFCGHQQEQNRWTEKCYDNAVPLISIPKDCRFSDRISGPELLNRFVSKRVEVTCDTCDLKQNGKISAIKGKFTIFAVNRRGYEDDENNEKSKMKKLQTKVTDNRSVTACDGLVSELIGTINHRVTAGGNHWVAYSRLDDSSAWYINNDSKKCFQVTHPLKLSSKVESVDLLLYQTF